MTRQKKTTRAQSRKVGRKKAVVHRAKSRKPTQRHVSVKSRTLTKSHAPVQSRMVSLPATHISIPDAKIIAPSSSEHNMAFKTLRMIYQNSEFSGDENKVFRGFLEHYQEKDMKKEELYEFLRSNPAIRRKLWESDVFE